MCSLLCKQCITNTPFNRSKVKKLKDVYCLTSQDATSVYSVGVSLSLLQDAKVFPPSDLLEKKVVRKKRTGSVGGKQTISLLTINFVDETPLNK